MAHIAAQAIIFDLFFFYCQILWIINNDMCYMCQPFEAQYGLFQSMFLYSEFIPFHSFISYLILARNFWFQLYVISVSFLYCYLIFISFQPKRIVGKMPTNGVKVETNQHTLNDYIKWPMPIWFWWNQTDSFSHSKIGHPKTNNTNYNYKFIQLDIQWPFKCFIVVLVVAIFFV